MNEQQPEEFDSIEFSKDLAKKLWDLKARNVIAIDLRGRVSYTDVIVVATATSNRHTIAIGGDLVAFSKKEWGVVPLGEEGFASGEWGLVDLGDVIVHLFDGDVRQEYDFEKMWCDAPRISLEGRPEDLYDEEFLVD